jgi:hypothetical protein
LDAERPANVPILAKTAGLLCQKTGALEKSARYYEEAIAAGDPDPLTLVALADVTWRLGRANIANECLERAEHLAAQCSNVDALTMVARTRARWTSHE